jgi:hypothetical protein
VGIVTVEIVSLMEEPSATFIEAIGIMSALKVDSKFIARLVELYFQNHSFLQQHLRVRQEVDQVVLISDIAYSIMVALAADSIAAMVAVGNIAIEVEQHNFAAKEEHNIIAVVMEQITRAKQEVGTLPLISKYLAVRRFQSRRENCLRSIGLERSR